MIGTTLSHYRITGELGRGGMGIVYQAEDTKLDRTVAIKILPSAALASSDDRERFYREAKSAAQLHHPNIASVFEIDEAVPEGGDAAEPRPFIAMEYIAGGTLQDKIKEKPLSLPDAVKIASQVAEALKAAHAKDIVHRDIKSANVMITEDGVAKVLDFGLAKTNQSTMLTRMGSTLGTVAYMSPEQARGQEVDGRTDLYSLGTMLYEMVAGRLPFAGEYEQAVVYSILNEPPEPLTSLRTGVPMQLEWIVNKLLAKDADYRYQTAADLLADLKSLDLSGSGATRRSMPAFSGADMPAAPAGSAKAATPGWVWPAVAAALLVGLASAWVLKPETEFVEDDVVRELILDVPGLSSISAPRIMPDGKTLILHARDSLSTASFYRYDLATRSAIKMAAVASPISVSFSPDGSKMSYVEGGEVQIIPSSGGAPTPLRMATSRGAAFLKNGSLIFSHRESGGLWLAPETGEEPFELVPLDSSMADVVGKQRIDGTDLVLFDALNEQESTRSLYLLDMSDRSVTRLGLGGFGHYLNSGHIIYQGGTNTFSGPLMARPFDKERGVFTGPEVAIIQNIAIWNYTVDRFGNFYSTVLDDAPVQSERSFLTRVSPSGDMDVLDYSQDMEDPRISMDGSQIAVSVNSPDDNDWIEILDLETGVPRRLTFEGDADWAAWSRQVPNQIMVEQSRQLSVYSSEGDGILAELPVDHAGAFDWSPDGRWVAYGTADASPSLRLFDMESQADTLLDVSGGGPRFSPDGRYVAYSKRDNNNMYSVVREVFGPGYARLTLPAGQQNRNPVWSPDGRSMMVDVVGNQGHRISIDLTNGFRQRGTSEVVFDSDFRFSWDFHPNGDLYVESRDRDISTSTGGLRWSSARLYVTMNWSDRVAELAPPSSE